MADRVVLPQYHGDTLDTFRRRVVTFLQSVVWTRSVTITTTPYTVQFEHTMLLVDTTSSNITINLPSAVSFKDGMLFLKKLVAANQVIIHPSGSDTIDNVAADRYLINALAGVALTSDGLKWWMF